MLLGAIVLIQNPKGGGLNASMGGVGQQLLGARRSTDIVEKLTWGFASALIIICLSTAFFVDKGANVKKDVLPKSEIEQSQMNKGFQGTLPSTNNAPAQQPQQQQPPQPGQQPAPAK